jgi:UDP-glucose 4-epimerase
LAIFALMQKILLTGGAGFIGSHIALALSANGYTPVLLDNFSRSDRHIPKRINDLCGKEIAMYTGDCRDRNFLRKLLDQQGGLDGVIHLAAYKAVGESVQQPLMYFDNNIGSMTALLEVMCEAKLNNFVFSSSCTVYGHPKKREVDESMPFGEAYSPYGYTKQACERLMDDVARSEPWLRQVSLRYFNPIGGHPTGRLGELPLGVPNNLVPYITQSAAGLRGPVTVFGKDYATHDGTCMRDYLHVCDLADAHVRALQWVENSQVPKEVFNIGTGQGVSVQEIIDTFKEVNQVPLEVHYGPRRAGDIDAIYANADKAMAQLHWQAKYSVGEALQHAWKWQKSL